MAAPTLINLPPPPSDPVTPSDMGPGTPNSGTTSLSALSTTAIKDGHKGAAPPHTHHRSSSTASGASTNTLDAERADRISRLAGLERIATARHAGADSLAPQQQYPAAQQQQQAPYPQRAPPQPNSGFFDPSMAPGVAKERSTVGSASATGSVGGRTTWASGSDVVLPDADKMSEDGVSSTGGLSDEGNASLVGFGEAAGQRPPRLIDGVTYDAGVVDTTASRGGQMDEGAD